MNKAFDLPGPVPLRKSYIVASTPRCGSTFLCTRLWATGVLGAPAEYFGYHKRVGTKMMERLDAASDADYLRKLLACRTSKNGVFGMNTEFNDFEEALRRLPGLLAALAPVTYVYVERPDQLVQAAFMAKSVQIDALPAGQKKQPAALQYDRDLISKWLGRIERQRLGWMRWFDANGIVPFVVSYEKFTTNPAAAVRSVVELLGVENDKRQQVRVALAERPSDRISKEWAARFEREIQSGIEYRKTGAADAAKPKPARAKDERNDAHIFDRYNAVHGTAVRPLAAKRLRHRYDAIVARNRALFKNARVLDLRSGDGRWSFAAIDAGAAHVVGVDSRQELVEAARKAFTKIGIKPARYEFVTSKLFPALNDFSPDAFDLVLCPYVSPDPHFFFKCLRRLRPKHVVLDTKIVGQKDPIAVFRIKKRDNAGPKAGTRSASLGAVPNHALIKTLSDYFGFRWRLIDWRAVGIADWAGIGDYKLDRRRTYVLDRIERPKAGRAS